MAIPDLEKANAVLIGSKWVVVSNVYPSAIEGWLTLRTAQFSRVNVRESAIEGIRFNDMPAPVSYEINTPWSQ